MLLVLQIDRDLEQAETHLLLQPVVVLDNACHHHVSALHVEGDLSGRLILEHICLPLGSVKKGGHATFEWRDSLRKDFLSVSRPTQKGTSAF